MAKQERLREAKQHGAAWFPFNIYPCTIPKDFPQVALHWQDSMELVFVKKGRGIVQAGLTTYTAQAGDIYVFAPGVLHALRQLPGEAMEYENIIFELELLGGAGDICAEKYLLPLQSGRLALPMRLGPEDWGYNWAVRCLHAAEEFNKIKDVGYELCIKGELLLFLAALVGRTGDLPPADTPDTRRLKTVVQLVNEGYARALHVTDAAAACGCSPSLYALVQENDRPGLYRIPERATPERRCRCPAQRQRHRAGRLRSNAGLRICPTSTVCSKSGTG